MKQLIIFITLIMLLTVAKTAYSVEDFTIWKVDATVQKFNDVYFAGQDDELILIVCDSILYRMNSSNGKYIDSLYFGKRAMSSAITNDGLRVYVSLWDSIVGYDVYDFSKIKNVPVLPLSGRIIEDDIRTSYLDISISNNNRYLSCRYNEANNRSQSLNQIIVYDLVSNEMLYRIDNSTNLVNEINVYSKPMILPDERTIMFITSVSGIGEVVFYDFESKVFSTRVETKTKLTPQTEFIFLNDNEVCITRSAIPSFYGFNVLNLKTNVVEEYFNFKSDELTLTFAAPYKINDNLFLLTLYNQSKSNFRMTFFDKTARDTSMNFYNIQLGAKIDINKSNTLFVSYSTADIYLHDLNQYLILTNVIENNNFYSIEISPNPSNNRKFSLNIKTDKTFNSDINLYNINGQLVLNIIKNKTFSLGEDILEFHIPTEISSGHYYIRLESEGGSEDVKIQF